MIGNLTGIGKTTGGGSSGNNWNYKKIYSESSPGYVTIGYVTIWLPDVVNNVNDLINYMWDNLPIYISKYNFTESGIDKTRWTRVAGLACGGVSSYNYSNSRLYLNYGISVQSSYVGARSDTPDLSLFPVPTTLSVASQSESDSGYYTIDDTWTISNI